MNLRLLSTLFAALTLTGIAAAATAPPAAPAAGRLTLTANPTAVTVGLPAGAAFRPRPLYLHQPERLVLDFSGARLPLGSPQTLPAGIKALRSGQFQDRTRVVLEATGAFPSHTVAAGPDRLTVEFAATPAPAIPRAATTAGTAAVGLPATNPGLAIDNNLAAAKPNAKTYTGRKISLEFVDVDVRRVFQLIAEVSALNFLIADDVTGTLTLKLTGVPWDQALDIILDSRNLGMIKTGNVVQIKSRAKIQSAADERLAMEKSALKEMELKSESFNINFADIATVAGQVTPLKSERGSVIADARTNQLIVEDAPPVLARIRALVKKLDIPERQVMIEARIVEASASLTRDLGIQWGLHARKGDQDNPTALLNTGFGGIITQAAPTAGTLGPGAALGLTLGKLARNTQLDVALAAAESNGQLKIVSRPRVLTLNNKAAKISQGQSIPYQTVSAEGTKTEFVEAALTLDVTPHITPDGTISLKVKASNNSPGAGSPPPINKKEATTEVLLRTGETVVIGGIYMDADTKGESGVPFLKDIPLLGNLFKSNQRGSNQTELLIFVTPTELAIPTSAAKE